MNSLYRGYGKIDSDNIHKKYGINLPETLNRKLHMSLYLSKEEENERNLLKMAGEKIS